MSDTEEDKQTGNHGAEADQGCPVEMHDLRRCGRPIYSAPPGIDKTPACLMHSHDRNKDDGAFQAEFERILKEAGEGLADFTHFVFPSANYQDREFAARCVFQLATFTQDAHFFRATFTQDANFIGTKFKQAAHFGGATFTQDANFVWATFTQDANFSGATFKQVAGFSRAKFMGLGEFRETTFRNDSGRDPGPIFTLTRFERPEAVEFADVDLGQALFYRGDVSKVGFSNVKWRRRENGKWMLFEEVANLEHVSARFGLGPAKGTPDDRNYAVIAELYQQLKKNYDDRRDYWTAGDFHYGEMEMKRRSSRRRNPVLRWLHRKLGLVAWYQYASDYGESYVKPFLRLLVVLALFALAYPAFRLHRTFTERPMPSNILAQAGSTTASADEVSYADFFQFLAGYPNRPWRGTAAFFVQSFTTSVGVAALRRDFSDYEPQTVWGRFATLIELLLTSTLVALFLLAVRRQFRR